MMKQADLIAARELVLYAMNTSKVYFNSYIPVCNNMKRKLAKGTFDQVKAVKAFEYVTEYAAKLYHTEFGNNLVAWHQVFDKATRRAAAEEILQGFLSEIE